MPKSIAPMKSESPPFGFIRFARFFLFFFFLINLARARVRRVVVLRIVLSPRARLLRAGLITAPRVT